MTEETAAECAEETAGNSSNAHLRRGMEWGIHHTVEDAIINN
jgi:hypothetical protein